MENYIDKRKVIVKHISTKCSEFTLQNFLEIVFDAEVDKIEHYKNNRETALVTFSEDIEDFNKSCQSPKAKKPLEGSKMQLLPVLPVLGIILENIQPNLTEDTLTFYFENKKNGGKCDGVKNCRIYSKLNLAIVEFVDSEIASSVLHINSHTIAGKSITIKPFIEAFHKETLDKLSKDKEQAVDSESYTNLQRLSPVKTTTVLSEKENNDDDSFFSASSSLDSQSNSECSTGSPWKLSPRSNSSSPKQDIDKEYFDHKRNSGYGIKCKANEYQHDEPCREVARKSTHALSETSTFQTSSLQNTSNYGISNENENEQLSLHFKPHEVKLIQKDFAKKRGCSVDFNIKNGTICISGTEMEIKEAHVEILQKKNMIEEGYLPLSSAVAEILKTEAGKDYIKQEIIGTRALEYIVINSAFRLSSLVPAEVQITKQNLQKQIKQEYLNTGQQHSQYLASTAWIEKKKYLEKIYPLARIVIHDNQRMRIDGLNGDVFAFKRNVEQELKKNSNISETFRLTGTKARCFQQLYLRDITDLKDVIRKSNGEYKEIKASDEAYIISVSGEQTKVRYVLSELEKLAKQIWHETIILHKDVAKPKDLEILIGGLQKSDLKKFQATFEVQHSCFLTIHLPNTSSYKSVRTTPPLDSLRSPSMPVFPRQDEPEVVEIFPERHREQNIFSSIEAPSRFFQEREPPRRILNNITVSQTNCKIMIHTSDITKQKMDILVNVVSSSQNIKSTRISQAFEKTGGPAFVQGYEGAKAMSVGSVIASSPAGNLNCSQVLTIVLNPCDPANQDASKMQLKKAINDCFALADTAKATSIAFPPVGCGVLFKYPPKFVAASFISAAKNAAKKGILQDIGFFIFDKKVYNMFLDEINPQKEYGGQRPHYSAHNFMMFPEQEGFASGDNTSIQIGSTTIQVLKGDITKHKASVLVNVITEDHDLRKTAVSQAFLRSGGASLNQAFQQATSSGEMKKIYVTKGYDLSCDYVYHVVVKKFDNSNAALSRQVGLFKKKKF